MTKSKKSQEPRLSIGIYRIKGGFQDEVIPDPPQVAGKKPDAEIERFVANYQEVQATVVIKTPRKPKPPAWKDLISTIHPQAGDAVDLRTTQSAVVLLVRGESRYALAFGHGRTLIAEEAIERRFGLHCALDLIDQESLISVGYKQVDHATLFSNIQANRRLSFDNFQVDTEASLLNGVVGRPAKETAMYSKALGADALHINPRLSGNEPSLTDLVDWLDQVYDRKGYRKKGYSWIDRIATVSDAATIRELEAELDEDLRGTSKTHRDLWFGPPEAVPYEDIESLSVEGSRGKRVGEIDLKVIQEARTDKLSVEALKKATIWGHNADGAKVRHWRAFRWLNWTKRLSSGTAVLQNGDFYLVERSFERRVDKFLSDLKGLPASYVDWRQKPGAGREKDYNKILAAKLKAHCLDGIEFHRSFRGHGKLELCDVLKQGKREHPTSLIFVKKYLGNSAALSHLFAQGLNSVEAVLRDDQFREELRANIEMEGVGEIFSERPPLPRSLRMVFVILTRNQRFELKSLPFFAKLTLFRTAKWALERNIEICVGTRAMTGSA